MATNKATQGISQVGGLRIGNGHAAGGRAAVVAAIRTVTDGVTNTDTSLVSATAVFVAGDVGALVEGAGIPTGTYILTRSSATTVVLSQATTATATAVKVTVAPVTLGRPSHIRFVGRATAKVTPTATFTAALVEDETVTVTGVKTGDLVVPIPPPDLEASLVVSGCFVSATDTVKLRLSNPTAGSLTLAAHIWGFLVYQLTP